MKDINNQEQSLSMVERVLQICDKYSVWKILKALLMLILVSYVCWFAFSPSRLFELYDKYRDQEHDELLEKRRETNPKIQLACDQLRTQASADRVIFLELHNGKISTGGLPFEHASASCESLADNIWPVADQYQNVSLSLLPFSNYLFENTYYSGDIGGLQDIDKSLMYRMMSNGVTHCAMIVVQGVDKPVGLLVLTYTNTVDHDCPYIRKKMENTALKLGVLVEVRRG